MLVKFEGQAITLKPGDQWECSCGRVESLPAYVHAHWSDLLEYKCDDCRREYTLLRGRISLKRRAPKRATKGKK